MYLYHYPDIWYDYAVWHARNGSIDAAIKVFQRALKALPDSDMLRYAYAEMEESRGAIQPAKKIYETLLGDGVNATTLVHIRALAKTLSVAQLAYLREQFTLLGPNKSGFISLQNFKTAVTKNSTDAMKDSRVLQYVSMVSSLQYRKLDFEEFGTAAISVLQLEGMESWEQHAQCGHELFEKDENRPIMIQELAITNYSQCLNLIILLKINYISEILSQWIAIFFFFSSLII